ncbi:hypothetical protein [Acetivibrio ethanolgignens]|uniref:Uncharacterized protein n=1 Tax=Acetivibrio ethanolgignens TaxID=290052 RepID=A0A0V8QEQ6_9FIRM|nr:hypothetical protein [Acetivibrio ethanolgignens]KSV59071.1 hypothetical protein ASU35_01780 [Acetivibrio ethanolgignens]
MVDKYKGIAAISGVLVMLSTALAFYLLFENLFDVKIQWISLLFLLLSEAILMAKFLLIRKQTIIADAHISSSVIHIVLVFLAAVLFIVFKEEAAKMFILINVVGLSVLIIADLLIYYTQCHTAENGGEQMDAQKVLYHCISQVQQLSLRHKGTSFYTDLCRIEELLKYSDNTAITGVETKIGELISELSTLLSNENVDSALIYTKTNDIAATIQERTAQMKHIKRGKY